MLKEGYHPLRGNGFFLQKLPENLIADIKLTVDTVQNNFSTSIPFNKDLAGHIEKEYEISLTDEMTSYIKNLSSTYNNENPNMLNKYKQLFKDVKSYEVDYEGKAWVNFQKKYEYNPIHSHQGILSYVIWHQIPYYKEDEYRYGIENKTRSDSNGAFLFVVPSDEDSVLEINLGVDKSMEGYIAMFPSNLTHMVYPFFSSEDYRITVSGNLFLSNT